MTEVQPQQEDTPAAAPADPFNKTDIAGFAADDVTAGRAIGKMLSLLFIYTVIAMSIVSWWTFDVAGN